MPPREIDPLKMGLPADQKVTGGELIKLLDTDGVGRAVSALDFHDDLNAVRGIPNKAGRGIRTVTIGDSLTWLSGHIDPTATPFVYDDATGSSYYMQHPSGSTIATADYGAFTWADALMGAPHYLIKNAGIGGQNTDDMLARLDQDVLRFRPELVYVWAGRNDFAQGKSFAYVRDNLIKMFDAIQGVGAFICTIDPPPSTTLNNQAGASRAAAQLSAWMRDEARRRNIAFVSALGVMADPSAVASGAAKAAYVLTDTTHNSNLGALRVGEAIARVMGPLVKRWENFPTSPAQGYDFPGSDANTEIRSSNPLFAGTGGQLGTGVTGVIASQYICLRNAGTPTVVGSIVEDREYVGNAQRLVMTATAANDAITFGLGDGAGGILNMASRFLADRIIEAQVDLTFSADTDAIVKELRLYAGGSFNGQNLLLHGMQSVTSSGVQGVSNNIQGLPLAGRTLRIRTPRVYMPAGATSTLWQTFLRLGVIGAGKVGVDVSRYAVRQYAVA